VPALTVGQAAERTGWSPRMLRYLERTRLLVPRRSRGGYRLYAELELQRLVALRELRRRFSVELADLAFALRLRGEPDLRAAVEAWLRPAVPSLAPVHWTEWEQRKHERLLAA
jgi:MerR family transcriptional regulator, copper efflux regulator